MNYLIPFLLVLYSCTSTTEPKIQVSDSATIFQGVNIIDVRDGSILSNQQVVVDSGKIVSISNTAEVQRSTWPEGVEVVDANGKYITPGLAEMHAHIPSPNEGEDWIKDVLFLYVANGVTTIRGMLGHPRHLQLREEAKNNSIISPRIYTSSPSFNGNSVPTPEAGRQKVIESKEAGYDFLKFHPGIKLEVHDEIVRTANEVGIPYAGHVSTGVGIRHALESNYATVDHVDGFLEGLVPESAGVNPDENGFFGFQFTELADTTMIAELVELSKAHEVWVVPTQALFERWFSPIPAEGLALESEMKYMPADMVENWVQRKKQIVAGPGFDSVKWEKYNEIRRSMIYQLQHEGQGLLLGSDAPQVFNVPGFSIHHEMQYMLEAGLTPLEILQTGTLNTAIFYEREGDFGEIVEEASADFILSKGNPLEDLKNLQQPDGVMVRGTWLDRTEIDQKLADLAARNKGAGSRD